MKSIRKLSRFLRGRWMRRLVWLPSILIAFLFLGATMQSKGFRLSLLPPVRSQPSQVYPSSNAQSTGNSTMASFPGTSRKAEVNKLTRVNQTSTNVAAPVQASTSPRIVTAGSNYQQLHQPRNYNQTGVSSQANVLPTAIPSPQHGFQNGLPAYVPNDVFAPIRSEILAGPRQDMDHANQIAAMINRIRGLQGGDHTALRDTVGELLELKLQQFDEKQSRERAELKQAKDTLTIWEEAIAQREDLKKPLIESHIAQLLQSSDPLNWSFSGAELLKNKTNHSNYQAILKELWIAKTNQKATPALPSTQLPEISTDENPPAASPGLSAY